MSNIFQNASKLKLRFVTAKGELSTEELWDLKLTDLDKLAREVNRSLKEEGEESFIGKKTKANSVLELKLEILKEVIAVKQSDEEKARATTEKRSQVEFLQSLLQKKKIDALESLPLEEIEKQLAALKEDA